MRYKGTSIVLFKLEKRHYLDNQEQPRRAPWKTALNTKPNGTNNTNGTCYKDKMDSYGCTQNFLGRLFQLKNDVSN